MRFLKLAIIMAFAPVLSLQTAVAQTVLTIDDCRTMALENSGQSKIAREKLNAAEYDRKAAFANYLPKVSAMGMYMHNSENINIVSAEQQTRIAGMGSAVSDVASDYIVGLLSDPQFLGLLQTDPTLQYLVGKMTTVDISGRLNAIGQEISDRLTLDIENVYVGAVTVEQPLFVGGKIHAYNKVTAYAQQLAEVQLEGDDQKVMVAADEAYWQIVSIAAKLRLTEQYVELLRQMDHNVEIMMNEGVATQSDRLSVKVQLNDAEMSQVKASNGLALAKMLLCQLCGLPLDSDIMLADESESALTIPEDSFTYSKEDLYENRSELKSLQLAVNMYEEKSRIVRADFLPTVALIGNYILTNPSAHDGIKNEFGGMWNVGVMAKIPLFHFGEGMNKYRKAKSDALLTQFQLDDARGKVELQVSQYEKKIAECDSRLEMARKNMENARENLRVADIGFKEGVVEPSLVMAAQTAWLKANSEEIDASIDRIMAMVYLRQATGMLK